MPAIVFPDEHTLQEPFRRSENVHEYGMLIPSTLMRVPLTFPSRATGVRFVKVTSSRATGSGPRETVPRCIKELDDPPLPPSHGVVTPLAVSAVFTSRLPWNAVEMVNS